MAQGRMAELTDILTDWLTVEEAAVFAGVDVKTILAWIKTGKVRVYTSGQRRRRFTNAWLT